MTVATFGYADTPLGQLHYAEAGEGTPVLLLHQTPRSSDEYREVLPLLARRRRAIAMDMYGFGLSAKPAPDTEQTIEQYAEGAIALLDALGIGEAVVVGHHTGSFVASEVASIAGDRIKAVILSAAEFADAAFRAAVAQDYDQSGTGPRSSAGDVDFALPEEDGRHLMVLWGKRYPLYPPGRPDLLDRFVRDALAPGVDPTEGHRACGRYRMEDRVGLVTAPVLVIANTADPVSFPHTRMVVEGYAAVTSVDQVEIPGGTVAVMEHKSEEVVAAIESFLDGQGL
ncbi:alpha/beta fold hydrolase [Nocardioides sp.]|uniref:alpha/beta fold hydrolase n=1 Tax=Nocardioides sp. TaxID=35761 RepID=UPI0039E66391